MDQREITLSIITPVYNGEKYIRNCILNIADQAFPGLEHLIMDGGSSDETVQIIQGFTEKYSHIRLISEKDNGQSNAMNKGIKMAGGRIIGFLNVDDYYEPDVLPRIPGLFEGLAEPAFICGNLNIWNPDGSFRHFNRPDRISLMEILSHKFEWPYNPSAYFYHKSLHELCGYYNEGNHYCMDYEFILEAAQKIPLIHVDQLWGNFCQVEESKTLQRFTDHQQEASAEAASLRQRIIDRLDEPQLKKLNALIENIQNPHAPKNLIQKIKQFFKF